MTSSPPTCILETALYVDDLDAAEAFYGGLLGLTLDQRVGRRHAFYRVGDAMLLLFDPAETRVPSAGLPVPTHGPTPGQGHVAFAAEAAELDRWRARFAAAGVEVEADFAWPNGARSIYVRDPAGNSVEFAEPRLWAEPDRALG